MTGQLRTNSLHCMRHKIAHFNIVHRAQFRPKISGSFFDLGICSHAAYMDSTYLHTNCLLEVSDRRWEGILGERIIREGGVLGWYSGWYSGWYVYRIPRCISAYQSCIVTYDSFLLMRLGVCLMCVHMYLLGICLICIYIYLLGVCLKCVYIYLLSVSIRMTVISHNTQLHHVVWHTPECVMMHSMAHRYMLRHEAWHIDQRWRSRYGT